MTERSKDPDTNRDFGRVLEEFERGQELHRGKGTGRKPVVRLEPEEPKGPERQYRAPEEEEDFATALAAFEQERGSRAPGAVRPRSLEPGAEVKGTVLSIDLETAFVDLGGKAEAIVRSLDLADEDGILQYRAGDPIRARVVGPDPESGALLLSPLGPGTRAAADPRNVLAAGDVVEGTVSGTNKGGAEVDLGSRRAFCPISQLADHFVEDAAAYVGQKLRFRVERYEEGRGRSPNIVLSRRALLEEEKAARAEAVRAGLEVGSVARGTVTALEPYGAFVDLGGLEGLVHVSQLSHRRVDHPSDLLEVGQELDVQVTALAKGKDGRDRVSLSVKALERDPWLDAMARYDEGSTHRGEVRRLESFGAFVELEAGVEGLLPIGELGGGRRLSHPREVLRVGQRLGVRVLALDPGKRRIRLGPVDEAEMAEAEPSVREALERHRAEGRGFGSMAHFFEKGRKR